MRNKFIQLLNKHNDINNNKCYLLVGDVGYSVIEDFEKKFSNYYLNVGVAEQNMASIAAGIASENNTVFIYSIANFPTSSIYSHVIITLAEFIWPFFRALKLALLTERDNPKSSA